MTPKPHTAAQPAEATGIPARTSESGPYVINLCSSTTPMALSQPQAPELKRFTFFMSRRREDGRERFRLHMGYFVTAAEADEWLNVVREIFPGAWVGEAPGKRLRERQAENAQAAAAAAARSVPHPAARPAVPPPVPAARPTAVPRASAPPAPRAPLPPRVPTVHAAARSPAPAPARSAPPKASVARPAQRPAMKPKVAGSNVREVLRQLDSPAPRATAAAKLPAQRPAAPKPAAAKSPSISDTQMLRMLEQRHRTPVEPEAANAQGTIQLLTPDDSGARRALRQAVVDNQPVAFAVQLQWSVQPIQQQNVPPLAIFSAYTLYTVEGSRDGRKWYGLRLGFFSDAISAKQVAYYVRSEFTTVAVVPVTDAERSRAVEENRRSQAAHAKPLAPKEPAAEEFKLIDDEPAARGASKKAATKPSAAAKAAARPAGRVHARAKSRPDTLEETLEILGASQLEIDAGRGEFINEETGVRHLKVEVRKNTAFSRLLDRLSDRVKS